MTKVGLLGIKVWICNGEVYDKRDLFQISGVNAQASAGNQQGGGYRGDKPRGGRDNKKRKNTLKQNFTQNNRLKILSKNGKRNFVLYKGIEPLFVD